MNDPACPLLGGVDPHGTTRLRSVQMRSLVAEIDILLPRVRTEPERRGLTRLRAMADRCVREHDSYLLFVGD